MKYVNEDVIIKILGRNMSGIHLIMKKKNKCI